MDRSDCEISPHSPMNSQVLQTQSLSHPTQPPSNRTQSPSHPAQSPSPEAQSPVAQPQSSPVHPAHPPDSLFERCAWFYALCREYLFRDHTEEIASSLFPSEGPRSGTHLLELGCGPGFYACRLAQHFPHIRTTGVDLSRNLIERARSRAASRSLQNCTFAHGDAHALPDASGSIDAIVVSRLFLIIPAKEAVLEEIFRVLRPGGRCFIAEPTSGFRTRIPLSCLWLLSKLTSSPAGKYREPRQADVMSRPSFASLIHSQPWQLVQLEYDGWYQYAVCTKPLAIADVEAGPPPNHHADQHSNQQADGHAVLPSGQHASQQSGLQPGHPSAQQPAQQPAQQSVQQANQNASQQSVLRASLQPGEHASEHANYAGQQPGQQVEAPPLPANAMSTV